MKRYFLYPLSLLLLVVCLAFISLNPRTVNVSSQSDKNLEETLKFRKMFNLNTNKSQIQEIAKLSEEFGVYLTSSEEKELKKRFLQQDKDMKQLNKYLDRNFLDDELSGVYVDQQKGGIINIGFSSKLRNSDRKIAETQSFFKDNIKSPVELKFYDHSEKYLKQIYDLIVKDLVNIKEIQGIIIYFVAVNIRNNSVELYINDITHENIKFLTDTYGDVLDIKKGDRTVDHNRSSLSRPLQGGIAIGNSSSKNTCTAGYGARDASGNHYLITAGHCTGTNWYQGGSLIGSRNKQYNSGTTDVMAIKMNLGVFV